MYGTKWHRVTFCYGTAFFTVAGQNSNNFDYVDGIFRVPEVMYADVISISVGASLASIWNGGDSKFGFTVDNASALLDSSGFIQLTLKLGIAGTKTVLARVAYSVVIDGFDKPVL